MDEAVEAWVLAVAECEGVDQIYCVQNVGEVRLVLVGRARLWTLLSDLSIHLSEGGDYELAEGVLGDYPFRVVRVTRENWERVVRQEIALPDGFAGMTQVYLALPEGEVEEMERIADQYERAASDTEFQRALDELARSADRVGVSRGSAPTYGSLSAPRDDLGVLGQDVFGQGLHDEVDAAIDRAHELRGVWAQYEQDRQAAAEALASTSVAPTLTQMALAGATNVDMHWYRRRDGQWSVRVDASGAQITHHTESQELSGAMETVAWECVRPDWPCDYASGPTCSSLL
jgi:hypothetical protein